MRYCLDYSGTRFLSTKIKITQFPDGFHLKLSMCLNIFSGNEKKKCHCGAKNCSSFLGVRPKNQVQEEKSKKPVDKRKKKRIKKTVVKEGKWRFLLHVGRFYWKSSVCLCNGTAERWEWRNACVWQTIRAIICKFFCDLQLTLLCSGLLQIGLSKGR